MSEWKKVRFLDVVHLNPRISLEKGVEYPFVEMSNVVPCARKPEKDVFKKYLGEGTKFEQGDTIVARIEPCLQNGKGFQCSYKQGFGSTEFLVFRPVNINDLDCDFLYYYMGQQSIREAMAKTMVGASGRQRVNNKVFNDLQINLPPLQTQHRIATILSRYDSLIENYQKQIKLLEEAAQRLYKEWFIDLHFPGHENTNILDGVPEGWEKKKLCEFTGITDGTHDSPKQVEIGLPLVTGRCIVDGSIDFSQAYNISEEDVIKINKRSAVEDGDILLSNIGTIGKVCRISKSGNYAVKNMIIFKPHDAIHSCFLHRFLTDNNTQMDFLQQAAGTSQKFVSLSFIRNTLILRPSDTILNLFYNHSEKYFNYVQTLQSQLRLLTEARDRLLPKLMSGEIEI